MEDLFYLQDSRSYVGNDMLWWALGGAGYTTDLRKAQTYTREEAIKHNRDRHTDVPWPKGYIDSKVRPAVDMQYCRKEEAMQACGLTLYVPPKEKPVRHTCGGCGKFLRSRDRWGYCPHCSYDNCP